MHDGVYYRVRTLLRTHVRNSVSLSLRLVALALPTPHSNRSIDRSIPGWRFCVRRYTRVHMTLKERREREGWRIRRCRRREREREIEGGDERVKRKRTTGMDGDERDDKAGGQIKLLTWDPPFSYLLSISFSPLFFLFSLFWIFLPHPFSFPYFVFFSPFSFLPLFTSSQLRFPLVYNMPLLQPHLSTTFRCQNLNHTHSQTLVPLYT